MTLMETMQTMDGGLTEREKDIRRYLLDHPEKVELFSARELGAATFTSASSVTRFCQKIGCKGYPDFKLRFLAELREGRSRPQAIEGEVMMTPQENAVSLLRKITEVQHRAVEQTRAELDLNRLIQVCQLLADAQHLDFYAYDSSACIAEYACNQFYFAGKRAQIYRDTNMQGLNASISATGHVAILLSHTGRNARLVALAKLLRRNGTPVVAITCSRRCPLADAAVETLVAVTLRDQINEFWVQSFASSAKYLLDLLASMVFSQDYAHNMERNARYEAFGRSNLWPLMEANPLVQKTD